MPVVLAKELGLYTAEGLDVSLEDSSGGSKAMQSLLAGDVDAVSSQADQVITMAVEGRELKSFFLVMPVPGVVLVALPQHGKSIRSIRDLKGLGMSQSTSALLPIRRLQLLNCPLGVRIRCSRENRERPVRYDLPELT